MADYLAGSAATIRKGSDAALTVGGVREAIEANAVTLPYRPRDSPDLNPIELAFSKPKRPLRDADERSAEALWQPIGQRLDHFTPAERTNHIRHCGFAQSGP